MMVYGVSLKHIERLRVERTSIADKGDFLVGLEVELEDVCFKFCMASDLAITFLAKVIHIGRNFWIFRGIIFDKRR